MNRSVNFMRHCVFYAHMDVKYFCYLSMYKGYDKINCEADKERIR
uniref:Uncharacterized protein n=1 Tax=Meloidogyne hapla TaxID=6305 RepID=A0A1I8B9T4_MELHA